MPVQPGNGPRDLDTMPPGLVEMQHAQTARFTAYQKGRGNAFMRTAIKGIMAGIISYIWYESVIQFLQELWF